MKTIAIMMKERISPPWLIQRLDQTIIAENGGFVKIKSLNMPVETIGTNSLDSLFGFR